MSGRIFVAETEDGRSGIRCSLGGPRRPKRRSRVQNVSFLIFSNNICCLLRRMCAIVAHCQRMRCILYLCGKSGPSMEWKPNFLSEKILGTGPQCLMLDHISIIQQNSTDSRSLCLWLSDQGASDNWTICLRSVFSFYQTNLLFMDQKLQYIWRNCMSVCDPLFN